MLFQYSDGGRQASGYIGEARDCVARSIALATEIPYIAVYNKINELSKSEKKRRTYARNGVHKTTLNKIREWLESMGWKWTPCVFVGKGVSVHLRSDELPAGRLIVRVSKHMTFVENGTIFDTFDPSRNGRRAVYGYFIKQ